MTRVTLWADSAAPRRLAPGRAPLRRPYLFWIPESHETSIGSTEESGDVCEWGERGKRGDHQGAGAGGGGSRSNGGGELCEAQRNAGALR